MNKLAILTASVLVAGATSAFAIEPVPGSITYGGHIAQLQKAPVGSTVFHTFHAGGADFRETYRVLPDQTLELVSRSRSHH
jgi:hypothetical protein